MSRWAHVTTAMSTSRQARDCGSPRHPSTADGGTTVRQLDAWIDDGWLRWTRRPSGRLGVEAFDRSNPPVSAGRYRFYVFRLASLIPQAAAELRDHPRQCVIGHRRIRPDGLEDFLFGKQMTGTVDHQDEQVVGFWLEWHRCSRPVQAVGVAIQHEVVPAI